MSWLVALKCADRLALKMMHNTTRTHRHGGKLA